MNDPTRTPGPTRRTLLLQGGAAAALAALPASATQATQAAPAAPAAAEQDPKPAFAPPPLLVPMQARADRIIALAVCTRPFRAQGPRIEAERVGGKTIVHNYGHGGSGWSLSWGAAADAVRLVRASGAQRLAVVGCGAIGLTTALVAQRAGLKVRIVAKDRPPDVRSSWATGVWSPASRICTAEHATPAFERRWEAMARRSFAVYQSLLGLAGEPVEWRDGYVLADMPFEQLPHDGPREPDYPPLERLTPDLRPRSVALRPGEHPFAAPVVRRFTQLVFNINAYARLLMEEFQRNGGEIQTREFTHPRQLAGLREPAIVNATGYGARALFGDDSVVPVRGQTARLVPQPDAPYGINWVGHNLSVVSRRDGILVQAQADGDFGSDDTTPDRAASEAAVARLASLFRG